MTREEAITVLQDKHDECKAFYDLAAHPKEAYPGAKEYMEALQMALAALRGPAREQVEKVWTRYRGGCAVCLGTKPIGYGRFKNRGYAIDYAVDLVRDHIFVPDCKIYIKFCPMCGRPLTDEAVEILLKRLEALKDG